MVDRLSPLDATFLALESPTAPMHVGGLIILEAEGGAFDWERMLVLLNERMHLIPRYRHKLRFVPGQIAHPVWVDDPKFDLIYHVQRMHLPQPGSEAELMSLAGRLFSRQLDRSKPLWEAYLIEGLEGGRTAILTKAHHCMVDGVSAVELLSMLVDDSAEPRRMDPVPWTPEPEPSDADLLKSGILEAAAAPIKAVEMMRDWAGNLVSNSQKTLQETAGKVMGVASSAKRMVVNPAEETSLRGDSTIMRRFQGVQQDFQEYREIRKAFGVSINDVALAVVTGALREWMLARGDKLKPGTQIRIMAPVSMRDPSAPAGGNLVSAMFIDVPVGEADPAARIRRINAVTKKAKGRGEALAVGAMLPLADFIAPNLMAIGARIGMQAGLLDTVVTNVPGPQSPLWINGKKMVALHPFLTTVQDRTLTHGVISYNGTMNWGITGERDAARDLPNYGTYMQTSLAALLAAARETSSA